MIVIPKERSPYDLLQEQQLSEPYGVWRILVVCQLLNRTHGRQVRPVADKRYGAPIFARWPSPHLMMGASAAELRDLIRPLRLVDQRSRNIQLMSRQYVGMLSADDQFWKGYENGDWCKALIGCGDYAKDSLNLLVYGILDPPTTDHWLSRYREWRLVQEWRNRA